MSVLQRMLSMDMETSPAHSSSRQDGDQTSSGMSSTLTVVNPVIERLQFVISQFTALMSDVGRDTKYGKYMWILEGFIDELFEEMSETDLDTDKMSVFFDQFGMVLQWCATGDDSKLPESMRGFVLAHRPQLLAIEA